MNIDTAPLIVASPPDNYDKGYFYRLSTRLSQFSRELLNPGRCRASEIVLAMSASPTAPIETTYQNYVNTTNATATLLHTFTVPASTTLGIEVVVVARRTGGAAGAAEDGAGYDMKAAYKNAAGTATLIGAGIKNVWGEDQAGWDISFVVSTNTVRLEVTGAANNNVTWHMTARTWAVSS